MVFNVLTDSFPIPTDGVPYEIGRTLRSVITFYGKDFIFYKDFVKICYQTHLIYDVMLGFSFIIYRLSPSGKYLPIMRVDFMSLRISNLVKVTPSTESMNLTLKYSPISLGKFRYKTFLLFFFYCICNMRIKLLLFIPLLFFILCL